MTIQKNIILLAPILILLSACQQKVEPRVCKSYIAPPLSTATLNGNNLSKFKPKLKLK